MILRIATPDAVFVMKHLVDQHAVSLSAQSSTTSSTVDLDAGFTALALCDTVRSMAPSEPMLAENDHTSLQSFGLSSRGIFDIEASYHR